MDDYSVWMSGGSLLLVAADVPIAQRQAVLDTLLYSQLVAKKSTGSRFTHYSQWYSSYQQTLSGRGWIITQLHRESKPASDFTSLAPIQPLQLWLETRYKGAANVVEQGVEQLLQNKQALDGFRQLTFEGDEKGTHVTLEVGLVFPGPVIHMCSVALATSTPLQQVGIGQLLGRKVLLGDVHVAGFSAELDNDSFDPVRTELRNLIAHKQQEYCFIAEVAKKPGEQNG